MKKIALEEAMLEAGTESLVPEHANHPEFYDNFAKLVDLGEARLKVMDDNDIERSVLSVTTPGLQGLATTDGAKEVAKKWNDYLIKSVSQQANRFSALVSIPTVTGEDAATELFRVAPASEVVGCMINGFDSCGELGAKYLDLPEYDSFWQALEKTNLPLYLHPRSVPESRQTAYQDFEALKGSTWGFHVETAEHCLRLMLSGVFDRFPNLKIIIGHMGEFLPFWAWRLDHRMRVENRLSELPCKKMVTDYLKSNFYITTSGYFEDNALIHAAKVMGIERVMFSVDYPYESTKQASQWFESIPFSEEEKQKMAYDNAMEILRFTK
jgi:2,3-dihydroxybenzoate decarboxylase